MEDFNVPKPYLQVGLLSLVCKAIVAFKIKSLLSSGNFVMSAHERLTLNRTDIRKETYKINANRLFYCVLLKKGFRNLKLGFSFLKVKYDRF